MADKLISELIEVINAVTNEDDNAELDLKEFEVTLVAVEVEFVAKNAKIKEFEKEVKKLGKEIEVLTESNENNVELIIELKSEGEVLRDVLVKDIKVKAEWLKDEDAVTLLGKELKIIELVELKERIDKEYNKFYNPDSEIQLDSVEIDNVNPADFLA